MSDISQLSDAELLAAARAHLSAPSADPMTNPNMAATGQTNLSPFGLDTGIALPNSVGNFLAGAGEGFTNLGHGIQERLGILQPSDIDVDKKLNAALNSTTAGTLGNVAGSVAATVPAMAIPGVNTYAGAGALGGVLGAITPTGTGDSVAANTGLGVAGGLGGQVAGNLIGRAVQPITNALNPEQARLAGVAAQNGIPLDAAQLTGSKPLAWINGSLGNLPFTAGPEAAKNAAQRAAFTKAVLARAGIGSDTATADVLQQGKNALGNTFQNIADNNNLDFSTNNLTGNLANIVQDASGHMPPASAGNVAGTVDQILSQVGPNDLMTGNNYQGWRTPLASLAKSGDKESSYYGQIKRALDSDFSSQVSGPDADSWQQASRQYANLKTIMNTMGGPAGQASGGQIPPTALAASLRQAIGKEGVSLGRGDLNDLAAVGQTFLRPPPDSGTASREFYQHALTGLGAAAIGGAGGGIEGHGSFKDIAEGAAMGAGGLGGARLGQVLLNSPVAQAYLTNTALSPSVRAALTNALRSTAIGASMAIPTLGAPQ